MAIMSNNAVMKIQKNMVRQEASINKAYDYSIRTLTNKKHKLIDQLKYACNSYMAKVSPKHSEPFVEKVNSINQRVSSLKQCNK